MKPLALSLRVASLAVIAVALLFVGAGNRQGSSYYPLRSGLHWNYEVSSAPSGQTVQLTVTNLGKQKVGGWVAAVQRLDVANSVGYRYTVARSDSITTVAERGPGVAEPTILDPPAMLLQLPVGVGQNWKSEATTTQIRPGTKIPVLAKVVSVSDQIDSPAGHFKDCVRIETSGSLQVPIPDSEALGKIGVETRIWYAKDIGVVQIERREFVIEPAPSEMSVTYHLRDFS